MRRVMIVAFLACFVAACGGEKKDGVAKPAQAVPEARPAAVVIEPDAPTVETGVRALPLFREDPRETVPLTYEWFVNNDRVAGVDTAVLPREWYRRGDRIRCRVRPAAGGRWIQSEIVKVVNAPPQFRPKPVAAFDVPGEFFHQVFATDPDNDSIAYRLLSPLDRGIELDPRTGVIRWRIERLPEEPAPPPVARPAIEEGVSVPAPLPEPSPPPMEEGHDPYSVRLVVEADDGHGGIARHQIWLDLRRGAEVIDIR